MELRSSIRSPTLTDLLHWNSTSPSVDLLEGQIKPYKPSLPPSFNQYNCFIYDSFPHLNLCFFFSCLVSDRIEVKRYGCGNAVFYDLNGFGGVKVE